jgi:hypothetical protein
MNQGQVEEKVVVGIDSERPVFRGRERNFNPMQRVDDAAGHNARHGDARRDQGLNPSQDGLGVAVRVPDVALHHRHIGHVAHVNDLRGRDHPILEHPPLPFKFKPLAGL